MNEISQRASLLREDRAFITPAFELRAEDDDAITFDGIASVVDEPYAVRDQFGEYMETMAKGAFTKTLAEADDVRLLVNHEGIPLARTKSGTLKLSATPHLRAVATLDPESPLVQGIRSAMDRGDLDQMSVGFRVTRQEWNDDYTERTIRELQLFDVSVVTYPANTLTSAALRSLDDAVRDLTHEPVDEATLRRTIAYLESLLPAADLEERDETDEPSELHPDLVAAIYDTARRLRPPVGV